MKNAHEYVMGAMRAHGNNLTKAALNFEIPPDEEVSDEDTCPSKWEHRTCVLNANHVNNHIDKNGAVWVTPGHGPNRFISDRDRTVAFSNGICTAFHPVNPACDIPERAAAFALRWTKEDVRANLLPGEAYCLMHLAHNLWTKIHTGEWQFEGEWPYTVSPAEYSLAQLAMHTERAQFALDRKAKRQQNQHESHVHITLHDETLRHDIDSGLFEYRLSRTLFAGYGGMLTLGGVSILLSLYAPEFGISASPAVALAIALTMLIAGIALAVWTARWEDRVRRETKR